jgi:dihydrodipicolinate synthase/N-acetylneuraminate lyase
LKKNTNILGYFYNYPEMTEEKVYLDFISTIMGKDYIKYIKKETNETNFQLINYFKNLCENNPIAFINATNIDYRIFGYYGGYWTAAYNYPREGYPIYEEGEIIGTARNVGLLTFTIEY